MAPAQPYDVALDLGTLRVLPSAGHDGLVRPLLLAAEPGPGPTDVTALERSLDHPAFSFLEHAHGRGFDVCLIGYADGDGPLDQLSGPVRQAVGHALRTRAGAEPLTVGGVGRGALAARHALLRMEEEGLHPETRFHYAVNSTEPSAEEAEYLTRRGHLPKTTENVKLITLSPEADTGSTPLLDPAYDDVYVTPAPGPGPGPLLPEDLATCLLNCLTAPAGSRL
ncbi:hypothetical protein ACFW9D_24520 [Streptomyces sp. NPDC059524]|uniref:hypothetical protein n=1 Tax=Streptomyces sp. NPDC059524 TaxID=3346856 RepID=UPI0036B3FA44